MGTATKTRLAEVIRKHERDILSSWMGLQLAAPTMRRDRIKEDDLKEQSRRFLSLLAGGSLGEGERIDLESSSWAEMRDLVGKLARERAKQGFSPSETATFVFSLKQPLFDRLRAELGTDPGALAEQMWTATVLLDQIGLYATDVFQKGREEVIARQQEEMMELSTPVVQLWEGILGLPLIGTLDSQRTQIVMENLLQQIVNTGARLAIIDITGVPTVDTLVAQHLLKTIAAARLMGAECIISGIRPQIAQTIVHLGVELQGVVTKATMADAFAVALQRSGLAVCRDPRVPAGTSSKATISPS